MAKVFNVTADCKPKLHYMVKLDTRLAAIRKMVDDGAYFTINRARQYGKTTILRALGRYLQSDYYVVAMDFQTISNSKFAKEESFCVSFANIFLRSLKNNKLSANKKLEAAMEQMSDCAEKKDEIFELPELFEHLTVICDSSNKPIVLLIDEVDSATNNQVFLDFLAQLRAYYIDRDVQSTFQSVILAGVYDIKNLRRKLRPDEDHKVNSPWNIAADFNVDMSFGKDEIAEMLQEYEDDYRTGMDVYEIAGLIYDYTSGYPFLVSRLCKLMDEAVYGMEGFESKGRAWSRTGLMEAVKLILCEKNTLFESLSGKLTNSPELCILMEELLFTGKQIAYNTDNAMIDNAAMLGFIKNKQGLVAIANRLFETRLYNYFLSTSELQSKDIYAASLRDKSQFIIDGHLNMKRILERFVVHFNDLYGDKGESFIEEEGRKYFLLYLRPIINGTGNYYIEAQTRELKRTDVIVDYRGEQYIIELKIWHGNEYNHRGEKQLVGYLEDYHVDKGYMVSFNFNKNKKIGVKELLIDDKVLIEAVV
ncbi:MAG: 9-O-acetyl-N-acetylneuraminate esterase [Lachnospiraceae bacterium]|nr:9-O-acetyl-N-acetylneuraminate esterase [Lachnospiraceae bacterium]